MAAPGDGAVDASEDDGKECTCGSNYDQSCLYCRRKRSSASNLPSSSSSCSLLSLDSYPVQDYDKLWRVFTASVKGFSIGAGIKGGLALFALFSRIRRRRSLPSSRKVEMSSGGADVVLALKETLRYGLFLGTFAGTFVSVDEIITSFGGHRRTAKWRALLAGAIAGPSLLLTGLNTQHTSLAIYILMRATVLASRCGIKSKRFGHICKPLTWAHGDILLMCLSSSQILSAYILKQDSLPSSYKSFLNKHGAKDPVILNGVREIACGLPFTNLEAIEKCYKSMGVDIKLDPTIKVPCSIIHGNQACVAHFFSFLLQAYKRALPVYLPVYLIPALIVHRQGVQKRVMQIKKSQRSEVNTNLSSQAVHNFMERSFRYCKVKLVSLHVLFICLLKFQRLDGILPSSKKLKKLDSCLNLPLNGGKNINIRPNKEQQVERIWTCFLFRIFKKCNVPMVAIGTFPTGLALAIEKKSRRIEISLYCFARAIESFFTCTSDIGYFTPSKKFKRADVLIFSISTAIIMHCYAMERDVFRSKYLNVLDWVFGIPLPPFETTPRKMRRCATTEF